MKILRASTRKTSIQPAQRFTGTVYSDPIVENPEAPSHMRVGKVTFSPGGRTAWHTHPVGQTLHVFHGIGRYQAEGGPVLILNPGDTVSIPPDVRHWHGGAPDSQMAHLALSENAADGSSTNWLEHVSDADYLKPARLPTDSDAQIARGDRLKTRMQPKEHFHGSVYGELLSAPVPPSRLRTNKVTFAPGGRTAWHTHPVVQVLHCLYGVGRLQEEGKPVQVLLPGDSVVIPNGLRHWHGAAPDSLFCHLSLVETDAKGEVADWQEHVADADYMKPARMD